MGLRWFESRVLHFDQLGNRVFEKKRTLEISTSTAVASIHPTVFLLELHSIFHSFSPLGDTISE